MDLQLKTKSVGGIVEWLDSTDPLRFLAEGVTIDSAMVRADANGKKVVPSGERIGRLASGKCRPSPATALAAAALGTDDFIDVDDASNFLAGEDIDIAGTPATIAADGIAISGGAGGSDRITLTGQIGAAKNAGDAVKGTDGSETAVGLLWGKRDCTDGDQVGDAIDMARVREARLPGKVAAAHKADLHVITFR